jgi:polyvinyl alcohol dehydrogenase (cytochrome)
MRKSKRKGVRDNVRDVQRRLRIWLLHVVVFGTVVSTPIRAAEPDPQSLPTAPSLTGGDAGQAVYQQRCAVCHDHPQERIPPKSLLGTRTHDFIVNALTKGLMQGQATGLSSAEIDAVATYIISEYRASRPPGTQVSNLEEPDLHANICKHPAPRFTLSAHDWNGFSPDLENARFQRRPGLRAADISRLKPKWIFAYPGTMAYGPPSVVSNRVFIGTVTGSVLSLDAKTGCTYWATELGAPVRTPVLVGRWITHFKENGSRLRFAAYFGDATARVHAVNAETGEPLWSVKVDEHAFATISGTPALYRGKLFVPLTSGEGSMGPRSDYSCCTFRGGIVALDAYTGKRLWKSYTIAEVPKPFKLNAAGTQLYAPAGVGIWSALTVDVKRGLVYGTTAESKTALSVDTSDAIMAFDLDTGARMWATQATANDNWIQGCEGETPGANCPDPLGPDADFDTPAMLPTMRGGREIIIAGQKSGQVDVVDPNNSGKILWQNNLAHDADVPPGVILRDRAQPGVVFGLAADDSKVYAAIADPGSNNGHMPLGMYALSLVDGHVVWHTPGAPVPSCSWGDHGCTGAQRTAVTLIPGALFAGSANGHILSYAADDGRVIWDFDTAHSYDAVNGVKAQGGSIEGIATAVVGGTLYVMSGYATYGGGNGDALIAFTVDGK